MKNEIKIPSTVQSKDAESFPPVFSEPPVSDGEQKIEPADDYPITAHPNIVPPTEFMAIGMYQHG